MGTVMGTRIRAEDELMAPAQPSTPSQIARLEERIAVLEAESDKLRHHLRVILTYLHPFPHSETAGSHQPPAPDERLHELIMGPLEELGGRVPLKA
jgi:hypothetical protein